MLWALLTLMTVLASVGLAIPLIRRRERQTTPRLRAMKACESAATKCWPRWDNPAR